MKKISIVSLVALCAAAGCQQNVGVKYPETRKVGHVDSYFGTQVPDPYRWLEDDRSDSTAAWVKAENEVTFGYLEQIPFRSKLKEALTKVWNYPKEGTPQRHGGKYFVYRNNGLQNQPVLYVSDGLDGERRVFLDPNTLAADGTTAVGSLSVSNDNKYVAYTLSSGGSDWKEIRLKDIDGNDLPDVLKWVKFTYIAWQGDGFYYSGYDAPKGSALSDQNTFNKVYYHQLGTPQAADRLVYIDLQNPLRYHNATTTSDERFLILNVSGGTDGNTLAVKSPSTSGGFAQITPSTFDYEFTPVENFGDDLYILTNHEAPRYRLMCVNLKNPARPQWKTIIPEGDDVLRTVEVVGDKLVAEYLHNAYSQLFVFDKDGGSKTPLALPGIGTLGSLSGKKGEAEMFYSFSSFATPSTIYRIANINVPAATLHKATELSITPAKYITEQVWYESKDSTRIPMFITYKEGTPRSGTTPTLLYGYGGFNISMTPGFSVRNLFFLEAGGIYAEACLRGGGEFGSEWHKAGTKLQKQNVFNDFIAAAEYLVSEKYTSPEKLAIAGGSNGGLLVGACMTQRPDLFRVALPAVGVMDMLRFHKFTVGWGWADDYGSSDSEEEFRYLLGYSPLHNIKAGACYPATLITTADHDDRVVPAHSFKFAATMQAAQTCHNPVLIRIATMAGHGAGKSTAKSIEEVADICAFTFWNLGIKYE
ncbi:MAG: prolyl oligopeptidase family serine peptidase [Prevotellaceae bacterium]|jgi:prolyl oligopeptidase|nr:prolyl oligopeptidase family serine peptidase [Prevotellaceae bacterium]